MSRWRRCAFHCVSVGGIICLSYHVPNGRQEITSCGSLPRFCAPGLHLLDCLEHISSDSKGSARCLCYRLPSQLWATVHGASFSANPLSAPASVRLLAPAI